jgi:hypothetical protein
MRPADAFADYANLNFAHVLIVGLGVRSGREHHRRSHSSRAAPAGIDDAGIKPVVDKTSPELRHGLIAANAPTRSPTGILVIDADRAAARAAAEANIWPLWPRPRHHAHAAGADFDTDAGGAVLVFAWFLLGDGGAAQKHDAESDHELHGIGSSV